MQNSMMQMPLLISSLLEHAERHHADQEVVSRRIEGDIHRTTFKALARRARQLASALTRHGMVTSDRIATLAWNGYRHLELYYAVSSAGAILHTLNPRLHAEQAVYIADHAEDSMLFFDLTFLPLVESIAGRTKTIKTFVALCDRAQMPASTTVPNLQCYEEFIATGDDRYEWPQFDENLPSSLCYTSGTTGNPKGVVYSHRSTVLHAFGAALPDSANCTAADTILPVVPMFHVNAWALPYVACMVGAKLVLPGPALDAKSLYELLEAEGVTISAGVPTIWQGLLGYVQANKLTFSTMRRTVIGGSACPPAMIEMFEKQYQVKVLHAWGMTETSPVATACAFKAKHHKQTPDEQLALKAKQGRSLFGIDIKISNADGSEAPWDGVTTGDLLVRGHWVASHYFKEEARSPLVKGWFHTGDVAAIDADGYVRITDRTKDVIKSGGEWISSIELENVAVGHPAVAMAACIAIKHPKWDERPLLVVMKKPDMKVTRDELIAFYSGRIASWQIPDDVVFVDSIPLGATGKMQKNKLREQFKDYRLPTG